MTKGAPDVLLARCTPRAGSWAGARAHRRDPPPDDVMQRPPRGLEDRVIDAEMWIGIAWVGAIMAVVSLVALDLGMAGGRFAGDGDALDGRTMAFTTLVLAQLINAVNARSNRVSAFRHLFTNARLWGAVALSVALQILVVQVPLLNEAFGTRPLSPGACATGVGLASIVLWADEAEKLAQRRIRPRTSTPATAVG